MENKSIRRIEEAKPKNNRRGAPLLYLALTVSYTAGIYGLSSIPGNIDPEEAGIYGIISWTPPALQNLLHVPLFGLLAWLWHRTLRVWSMCHRSALTASFILAAGFGVFDEWHQLHVPGRYASFTDIVLNCTGVIIALYWINHGKRRTSHPDTSNFPAR